MSRLLLFLGILAVPVLFERFISKWLWGTGYIWDTNLPFYENVVYSFVSGAIGIFPIVAVVCIPFVIWLVINHRKT